MSKHHRLHGRERPVRARRGRRRQEDRAAFLARMTELLAGSLDLETTLANIASLALPHDGAWCIVDVLEGGHMRRIAIVHGDPRKQALVRRLETGWPPQRSGAFDAPRVMATRTSEVVSHVTPEMIRDAAPSHAVLETLEQLGIGSLLMVPLMGESGVLGCITYVSPSHGHVFTTGDVAFAENMARRAGQAIENARLFGDTRRAERRADRANRAKMAFLASLSHELRTPLHAISGYAQLLMDGIAGPLTKLQAEHVARIAANEGHLLRLVDSVLSYARVEAGRTEYHLEDVEISTVYREIQAIVEPAAIAKGVAYEAVVPPPPPVVMHADRQRLCQIMVNLVSNAVKFSRAGEPVRIECRPDAGMILISVIDTGVGIASDKLEAIFLPFIQAHAHGTDGENGTGLGLAISRRMARDMGGNLVVTSTPGVGSTFTVSLPAAAQA